MINKKNIHFAKFETFITYKLSANAENTSYTLNGALFEGEPDILWQTVCYINDTKLIWTGGVLYNGTSKLADIELSMKDGLWEAEESSELALASDVALELANTELAISQALYELNDYTKLIISYTEITYQELVTLQTVKKLIPGTFYRIIDYVTVEPLIARLGLSTPNIRITSEGHPFDLIVLATSNCVIDTTARAERHKGDTYFVNQDLSRWEIKYLFNPSHAMYTGLELEAGGNLKGYIYYMKDDNNNECCYDFKNFTFDITNWVKSQPNGDKYVNRKYYTFSKEENGEIVDCSLTDACLCNSIIPTGGFNTENASIAGGTQDLFGQVIILSSAPRYNTFKNLKMTFIDANCINNYIDLENSSSWSKSSNYITNTFNDNTIVGGFGNNDITGIFTNNTIFGKFESNKIEDYFLYNLIHDDFTYNKIHSLFNYNLTKVEFKSNEFNSNFLGNFINYSFNYNIVTPTFNHNITREKLIYLNIESVDNAEIRNYDVDMTYSGTSKVLKTLTFHPQAGVSKYMSLNSSGEVIEGVIADLFNEISAEGSVEQNNSTHPIYRYMLCGFTSDGKLNPISITSNNTTTTKKPSTLGFDPKKSLKFYNSASTVDIDSNLSSKYLKLAGSIDIRYSILYDLPFSQGTSIYLKFKMQSDGLLHLDLTPNNPIYHSTLLPTENDEYYYWYIGKIQEDNSYNVHIESKLPIYKFNSRLNKALLVTFIDTLLCSEGICYDLSQFVII